MVLGAGLTTAAAVLPAAATVPATVGVGSGCFRLDPAALDVGATAVVDFDTAAGAAAAKSPKSINEGST